MRLKEVFLKLGATALIAQAFSFAVIPILSRIYSPSSFADFSFWMSIAGLLGGVLLLKQDQYYLSRNNSEWGKITSRIIAIYAIASAVFLLILLALIATKNKAQTVNIFLLFFATVSTSLVICLSNIGSANSEFNALAFSRLAMTLSLGILQISLGAISDSPESLITGFIGSQIIFISCIFYIKRTPLPQPERKKTSLPTRAEIKKSVSAIFSSITLSIATGFPPTILFILGFKFEAGIVALLQRLLLFPVTLLAMPLSQVFIHHLKSSPITSPGKEYSLYILTPLATLVLFYISTKASSELSLFSIFLGNEWLEADKIAPAISLIYGSLLIRNITSQYFAVKEEQEKLLPADIIFIATTSCAAAVALNYKTSLNFFLACLSLAYIAYSLIPLFHIVKSSKNK